MKFNRTSFVASIIGLLLGAALITRHTSRTYLIIGIAIVLFNIFAAWVQLRRLRQHRIELVAPTHERAMTPGKWIRGAVRAEFVMDARAGGESEDTFRIYARMTDEERAAFDQWYASIPARRGMSVAFFDWPGFADVRRRLTDEAV
jgi:hypothetical protein